MISSSTILELLESFAHEYSLKIKEHDNNHIVIGNGKGPLTATLDPNAPDGYRLESENQTLLDGAQKAIKRHLSVDEAEAKYLRQQSSAPKLTGFRKAERKRAKLRLAITGPSGAGKTASALLIAYGLVGDWEKIGIVDTECGRGELYTNHKIGKSDIGSYQILSLEPPYAPERYIEAIQLAEDAGLEVVILDSLSHAWQGEGGCLEIHDMVVKGMNRPNSYAAWGEVTPRHRALIDRIIKSSIHAIATMRSKMEYSVVTESGKAIPKKIGLGPIQRDGTEYDFTTVFDISIEHVASVSKDSTGLFDGLSWTIDPDTGRQLKDWLESGKNDTEVV